MHTNHLHSRIPRISTGEGEAAALERARVRVGARVRRVEVVDVGEEEERVRADLPQQALRRPAEDLERAVVAAEAEIERVVTPSPAPPTPPPPTTPPAPPTPPPLSFPLCR